MMPWFTFFFIIQLIHFLATWKLYQKAGRKSWEALVPIYNAVVLMKIINRPKWWVPLLFVPIVNLIIFPVVWVETIRSFGKYKKIDTFLVIISLGFYIGYLNYSSKNISYVANRSLDTRTALGEWVSSILFAIVAATLVHTYIMQPFTIPTSSLEKTLLVGDFLFVSKFHYGARLPMTAVAAPMVHDTIPLLNIKSYLKWPQIPYLRMPGFQSLKKNHLFVYNWPADTVQKFHTTPDYKFEKPIDKKSNYVKRCVGSPGDSLEIKDGFVYINGNILEFPERTKIQYQYTVEVNSRLGNRYLYNKYGISEPPVKISNSPLVYIFRSLTDNTANKLARNPLVLKITKNIEPKGQREKGIFPNDKRYPWNQDNYGPIYIPEKGKTIDLNRDVLPLYRRLIEIYENNIMEITENEIRINGKAVKKYTFKQNYYWGMGDNRNNSEDSRSWGFIPEDHIVGKAVFIWFSWDKNGSNIFNKIRWNRLFTIVHGDGDPKSYFFYSLTIVLVYFGFSKVKNYKKRT